MSSYPSMAGLPKMHPGEFLDEITLPALKAEHGVTKAAFASYLGMTRAALDNVLKGRSAVTPTTAVRLAQMVGATPEFWLGLQADYDLEKAREELAPELSSMPRFVDAA